MNGSSMWEAPFVNTFQNKDNLLINTRKICKSSYKMQRNVIAFFCTFIFSFKRLWIYIVRVEKMFFLSSFLLILWFFFQTREKKKMFHFYKNNYEFIQIGG